MYKTEEEFLKNYNSDEFKKLSMTADILVFSISEEKTNNYRKTTKKKMSILLVKRKDYPFKDKWCLPGGFLNVDNETLEDAAKRILLNETNLKKIYLEQLYTFSDIDRDPRMRIVSTSYLALVDKNKVAENLNENASWFDIDYLEDENDITMVLNNGVDTINIKARKKLINKTSKNYKYEILKNDGLAFDHANVILTGLDRIKNKIEYTDIVFNVLPKYFTLGELQQVYETILGKKLLDPAFRRIIAPKVVKTDKVKTGEGHRPSYLYTYKED